MADIINSGCYGDDDESVERTEPLKAITTAHIDPLLGFKTENASVRYFSRRERSKYVGRPGDIFVVKSSGSNENVITGKRAQIRYQDDLVFTNFLLRVRANHRSNPRFLYHLLGSSLVHSRIKREVATTTYPNLNLRQYLGEPLPFPDLATQRQIADFLDRETARIDLMIEKKQRFLNLASERWRAVLNHHIFPNSPDWDGLPNDWKKTRLKFLTDQKRPIMYGIVLPGPNMEDGPMIVKGGDVKPGRLDPEKLCRTTVEIEAPYVRSRLEAGDLVISIRGSIGDIEIVPPCIEGANLTQDAARIAPRKGVDVHWLRYALQSTAVFHPLEAKSLGAAVRGINIFDLKRVYVPTPPSDEQTRIASTLSIHEQRLTDLKLKVLTHADRLKEYRSALITAAVTGQIDVSTYSKSSTTDRRLDANQEEMDA